MQNNNDEGAPAQAKTARQTRARVSSPSPDRLPPHDVEAEAGALGCVLIADDHEDLLDQLCERDFYDLRHLTIFRTLLSLQQDSETLDTPNLYQRLKDRGELQEAGDFGYVGRLVDSVSSASFPTHLTTVKDRAARRKCISDAAIMERRARDLTVPVESNRTGLPAILDASNFLMTEIPEPKQLVQGIIHQGSKLAIGGGSKSFKTWALIDLGISVAHGLTWLKFPTVKGKVLYVNFEIQDFSFQHRLRAVANAKGVHIEPGAFHLLNLRGRASDHVTLLPQIKAKMRGQDFALVILDPVYKLYGRTDENAAGDVAALLNGFEALAVETGAAVAFGAHFSKGNQSSKESIDRISGSGVFARDPDSLLILTRHETEDAFAVDATLRNFPQVEPFVVRWDYPVMVVDDELDPAKLKQPAGGRPPKHDKLKILAAIADTTAQNPISVSAWASKAKINRTTLIGYLETMRASGWIATSGDGSSARQYITTQGRAMLPVATHSEDEP